MHSEPGLLRFKIKVWRFEKENNASSNVDLLLLSQSNANVLERIRNMKQQFVPITICIRAWIRENPNYFI